MSPTRRLLWALALIALATAIYATIRLRRDLVDFEVYRTAAHRASLAQSLYRPEDGHYQFKYLPAFALLVAPTAWAGPELTKAIWFALGCGLVIVFFTQSVDLLPDRHRSEAGLIALTALVTAKLWIKELVQGQTNLWLAVLIMGALAFVLRRRLALAGGLVGAAVFVKPYALIFLPWLAVATGWTGLAAFALTVVAGLSAPALIYGWHGNLGLLADWWRTVTNTTTPNLLFPENMSLASLWAKWLGAGPTATMAAVLTCGVLFGLALTMFLRRRAVRNPSYLEIAVAFVLIPILSPQGWDYMALLGIPATMAVFDRWQQVTRFWRLGAAAAVIVTGFTLYDLLGRALYLRAMSVSILTLATVLMTLCAVHLRWRALA